MNKNYKDQEEKIREEAATWLSALDSGRADPVAFEEWRNSDPAHAIAFIKLSQIWRMLDEAAQGGDSMPDRATEEKEGTLPESAIAESTTPESTIPVSAAAVSVMDMAPSSPSRRVALKAAAVTAFALIGGKFAYETASARTEETGIGERRRFYAGEYACIDLNTASTLKWWKSKRGIEIELHRGQMLVDLLEGAPACHVRAGSAALQLGTGYYDVRLHAPLSAEADVAEQAGVELVTLRGHAQVTPADAPQARAIMVGQKQRISVSDAQITPPVTISDDALYAVSAWKNGELVFDGEPLEDALAEYNRYLRTPLKLDSAKHGQLRLGGRFLANDPAEFLGALRANFGIVADRREDHILLRKAERSVT